MQIEEVKRLFKKRKEQRKKEKRDVKNFLRYVKFQCLKNDVPLEVLLKGWCRNESGEL